jgi:type I restriction enzyme M protein
MIILSKGNSSIRIVDAAKWCKKGRRQSEFTDEHIQKIVAALKCYSENSRAVIPNELVNDDYNLDPAKRLEKPVNISSAISFVDVIKNITRGSQLNADTLDEISSSDPT